MKTAYISHPACLRHEMAEVHPECPQRLTAVESQLKESGLMAQLVVHDAPKATAAQLARAHDPQFVEGIFAAAPSEGLFRIDGDTAMNPFTLEAALRAAGAGVLAVDLVLAGDVNRAFCNVRPPGHHAEADRAMGFCFFNSIAVAALHALQNADIERIAIIDFDVHHGNGTEDIFAKNAAEVLFCSSYQHPFYPGYAGRSIPSKVANVPLAAGAGGAEFRAAVSEHWLPELNRFKPQLVFISAGFDAHADDAMSGLNFSDDDYLWVSQEIAQIANKHAQGRIISMLEGGYDLASLGRASAAHVGVLVND